VPALSTALQSSAAARVTALLEQTQSRVSAGTPLPPLRVAGAGLSLAADSKSSAAASASATSPSTPSASASPTSVLSPAASTSSAAASVSASASSSSSAGAAKPSAAGSALPQPLEVKVMYGDGDGVESGVTLPSGGDAKAGPNDVGVTIVLRLKEKVGQWVVLCCVVLYGVVPYLHLCVGCACV
jgi:hypothetical protein